MSSLLDLLELNTLSYTLIAVVLALVFVPIFLAGEPDTHPMTLQRQSIASKVRMPKESAVHRSIAVPHGYPLQKGLGLPGEKAYEVRDGDVRDIWELQRQKGTGKIVTIRGNEKEEHDVAKINNWIHAIGGFIHNVQGARRVATYLPNDIEHLVVSFAAAYYGFTLIPLPYPLEEGDLSELITKTGPQLLVASAGTFPLSQISKCPTLKHVMFSVEVNSRHLDWSAPSDLDVASSTFHGIIENNVGSSNPPKLVDLDGTHLVYVFRDNKSRWTTTNFTHKNIIAGVAAQMYALPKAERMTEKDVFLPVDGLWEQYTRVLTYTALASGATLAINSVAGHTASLERACKIATPTVIVASTATLLETVLTTKAQMLELWHEGIHFFQNRTLSYGRLPKGNWLTRLNDYERPKVGTPASRLRLVFTAENAAVDDSPALNSVDLADLRIFLSAHVCYGLTSPLVAGAVAQQNVYDYRVQVPKQMPSRIKKIPRKCAHFGPPVGSVEVKLVDTEGFTAEDKPEPRGEIVVAGPAVVGGKAGLSVVGKWRGDGCLAYVLDGINE